MEYAMAVRITAAVQRLQGSVVDAESRPCTIGPIILEVKQTGERSAGNPHAAFDVAGAGNVAQSRWCDPRKRKGETTGNTNFDLNRRASPRRYLGSTGGEIPPGDSTKPEELELSMLSGRAPLARPVESGRRAALFLRP